MRQLTHKVLPKLTAEEIDMSLTMELRHWRFAEGHLTRTFKTYGWKGSLMVTNTIGHLAEAAWHHPDLSVSYSSVTVRLQSHDAGGITRRDVDLARMIEQVVFWQPAKTGSSLEGTPQTPDAGYIKYD